MRNKRKGILMASAILGSAAIVSTGFAAWVVSTNVTETATGNIEVDDVNDKRITITGISLSAQSIVFGANDAEVANAWLTNDEPGVEVLESTISFTPDWTDTNKTDNITIYTKLQVGDIVMGMGDADVKTVAYDSTDLTLFELDTTKTTLPAAGSVSCAQGVATQITIAFKWGTAFGGMNPFEYFNSTAYYGDKLSEAEIEEAVKRLNAIKEWDTKSFVLSLSNNSSFSKTDLEA